MGNTTSGVQTLPARSRATTFSGESEGRAVDAKSEGGAKGRVRRQRQQFAMGDRVRQDSCPGHVFGARRRGHGVWGVANYHSALPPPQIN